MGLKFHTYQSEARKTAIYPNVGHNLVYPTLGLNGEAGEIAEKVKKLLRDDDGKRTREFRKQMKKELGDVLWYVAAICTEMGFSMGNVAKDNLEKLNSRAERDVLSGSGDDR